MSFSHRLHQLQQLTLSEWWILLIAMLFLPLIALSLHWKGYQWTRSWLAKRIPENLNTSVSTEEQLETAISISRMVSVAANHGPYHANCLKKALVAWWLLGRRGIHTELAIGVNKEADEFNAHAWLEYEGNILIDADDVRERFSAFDSKPNLKDC